MMFRTALAFLVPFILFKLLGLVERDRKTVEELYVSMKIQVLIATATVAWGVNFPTHLVIIKGTEFYDGKLKRYVDMPITDVVSKCFAVKRFFIFGPSQPKRF